MKRIRIIQYMLMPVFFIIAIIIVIKMKRSNKSLLDYFTSEKVKSKEECILILNKGGRKCTMN